MPPKKQVYILENYIREVPIPNEFWLNIFNRKGRKIFKIYDMKLAELFVEKYNQMSH